MSKEFSSAQTLQPFVPATTSEYSANAELGVGEAKGNHEERKERSMADADWYAALVGARQGERERREGCAAPATAPEVTMHCAGSSDHSAADDDDDDDEQWGGNGRTLVFTARADEAEPQPSGWRCSVCDMHIETSKREHESSIVHQFSLQHQPKPVWYTQEHTFGYRILRDKMGWNEETGLGRTETGVLEPVKTRLKRGRDGIGGERGGLRVTHRLHATRSTINSARNSSRTISENEATSEGGDGKIGARAKRRYNAKRQREVEEKRQRHRERLARAAVRDLFTSAPW